MNNNLLDVLNGLYEACLQKRLKELKAEILCPCGKETPEDCECKEVEESMTFPRRPGKTYSRIKGVPERPKAAPKKPMSNKEIVNDIINNYADGTPRKKIKEETEEQRRQRIHKQDKDDAKQNPINAHFRTQWRKELHGHLKNGDLHSAAVHVGLTKGRDGKNSKELTKHIPKTVVHHIKKALDAHRKKDHATAEHHMDLAHEHSEDHLMHESSIEEGAFKNQDVLKKDKAVLRDKLAGKKDENKKKAIHQQIKSIQSQIKEDEELDLEEEVNIFFDEDTEEIFIESDLLEDGTEVELDEDLISEILGEEVITEKIDKKRRRIVIRVNSKGKRTRKIICGKGMITKKVNGSVRCIRMTGAAKMRKRMGQRKRLRTLKRKGAGFQRRLNIKRQRAMRRRKAMGLKPKRGK